MILSVKKLCISGICLILILPFANCFQSKNHQTCLLLLAPNLYCTELNFMYSCVPNILTATRCQQCFMVKKKFHFIWLQVLIFLNAYVCVCHTYVYTTCVSCPWRSEEGIRALDCSYTIVSCCVGAGKRTQSWLLCTKQSLQPFS